MACHVQNKNSVYLKIANVSEAIRLSNILKEINPIDYENFIFTHSLASRLDKLLKTPPPPAHIGESSIIIHFFPISEAKRFLNILRHTITKDDYDLVLVRTLHMRLTNLLNTV
jgi:hypothetical protein